MKTTLCSAASILLAAAFLAGIYPLTHAGDGTPAALPSKSAPAKRLLGLDQRIPWTTSRITGSPEPPPPYRIERAFPKLTFKNPLLMTRAPGTGRLFVGEQFGKIYSFPNDQGVARADLFLDLTTGLHSWDRAKVRGLDALYGLA